MVDHLIESARFLKKVSGPGHDNQFPFAAHGVMGERVEVNHGSVQFSHDKQGGGSDCREGVVPGQVRPAAPRNDRGDPGIVRRGAKCRAAPGAGPEIAGLQVHGFRQVQGPVDRQLQPRGEQADIENVAPVQFLVRRKQVQQQGRQSRLAQSRGNVVVARAQPAAAAAMGEYDNALRGFRNAQDRRERRRGTDPQFAQVSQGTRIGHGPDRRVVTERALPVPAFRRATGRSASARCSSGLCRSIVLAHTPYPAKRAASLPIALMGMDHKGFPGIDRSQPVSCVVDRQLTTRFQDRFGFEIDPFRKHCLFGGACSAGRNSPTFQRAKIPSAQKWSAHAAGQHVELGIAENNFFLMLASLGLSAPHFGTRLIPVGTVYDPFIARGLDALNYGCYQDSRFLLVGTPSGLTLAAEGGAHQSINTPLIGMGQPNLAYFEPAYADELALMMRWAFEYLQQPDGSSVYLRLSTRPVSQLERPDSSWEDDALRGGYWLRRPAAGAEAAIVFTGAVATEALAAWEALADDIPGLGLLNVTSPDLLHRRRR